MARFREEVSSRSQLAPSAPTPRKIVLRGRIVTMDAAARVIPDGLVCIGDDRIAAVVTFGSSLPSGFQQSPVVNTQGTLYPGLIELHNHPAYNAIPLWKVPALFPNRAAWRSNALYKRQVFAPAAILTHHPQEIYPKSVARFVECRALLGGVTTTQGLTFSGSAATYYEGLVRNVECPSGKNWPRATDHINDFSSFAEFRQSYGPLIDNPLARFVMHLCEGTDVATAALFNHLKESTGKPLIGNNLIAIHATALASAQFAALRSSAGIVWSPTSNFLLYGATTDVAHAKRAGVAIALGCDWSPSGTKNLLGELKVAKLTSTHLGGIFSDVQLVRMVSTVPATMMGWEQFVGSLEAGKQADVVVIGGNTGDPYSLLISASESDVAAVLVGGKLRAARSSIADPATEGIELIHVAKQDMVLDLIDEPSQPLAGVSLKNSIATLAYALEHLPDLAKSSQTLRAGLAAAPTFQIRLEMDEALVAGPGLGMAPSSVSDVEPLELDPITSVDDSSFVDRLRNNRNLPSWLKKAL
jgi:5-methylthioadenosine/S-adenosylhomocysteine deaminase